LRILENESSEKNLKREIPPRNSGFDNSIKIVKMLHRGCQILNFATE